MDLGGLALYHMDLWNDSPWPLVLGGLTEMRGLRDLQVGGLSVEMLCVSP